MTKQRQATCVNHPETPVDSRSKTLCTKCFDEIDTKLESLAIYWKSKKGYVK